MTYGPVASLALISSVVAAAPARASAPSAEEDWRAAAPYSDITTLVAGNRSEWDAGTLTGRATTRPCAFGDATRVLVAGGDEKRRLIEVRNELLYGSKLEAHYGVDERLRYVELSGDGYRLEVFFDAEGKEIRREVDATKQPLGLTTPLEAVVLPDLTASWSPVDSAPEGKRNTCLEPLVATQGKVLALVWSSARRATQGLESWRTLRRGLPFLGPAAGMPRLAGPGVGAEVPAGAVLIGVCPIDYLRNSAVTWILGAVQPRMTLHLVNGSAVLPVACPTAEEPRQVIAETVGGQRLVGIWVGKTWYALLVDADGRLVDTKTVEWRDWYPDDCSVSYRPTPKKLRIRRSCQAPDAARPAVLTEEFLVNGGKIRHIQRER